MSRHSRPGSGGPPSPRQLISAHRLISSRRHGPNHAHSQPVIPLPFHSARISLRQINAMEYEYEILISNVYVCLSVVLSVRFGVVVTGYVCTTTLENVGDSMLPPSICVYQTVYDEMEWRRSRVVLLLMPVHWHRRRHCHRYRRLPLGKITIKTLLRFAINFCRMRLSKYPASAPENVC